MTRETPVLKDIQLALSNRDIRLFRNNQGTAWRGDISKLPDGSLLICRPMIVHFGFCEGAGDLLGWQSRIITADMVGQRIAQFASVEVKSPTGRTDKKRQDSQQTWIDLVRGFGGLAGIARSVEDARRILMP